MKRHRECTDEACFMYVEEPRDTYGPHWVGYCADIKAWRELRKALRIESPTFGESILRPHLRMVKRDTRRGT